jgi:hypothetical protein
MPGLGKAVVVPFRSISSTPAVTSPSASSSSGMLQEGTGVSKEERQRRADLIDDIAKRAKRKGWIFKTKHGAVSEFILERQKKGAGVNITSYSLDAVPPKLEKIEAGLVPKWDPDLNRLDWLKEAA